VTTLPSPSAGNQLHAEGDAEIADIADRVALLGHNLRNSRDRPSIALRIEAQSAHSGGQLKDLRRSVFCYAAKLRECAPVSAAHWRWLYCNDGCDTRLAAQPMLHVS